MRPSESLRISGRPIAYFPQLAKPLGGVNASILFSHFFYWHEKATCELGIWRTAEAIEQETGLSVQEQRTARAKLRERGILIETEKRIEHRIYYKLDLAAFDRLILEESEKQIHQHSGSAESTAPKCNINSPEVQNQHSGSAESTAVIGTVDYNSRLQQKNIHPLAPLPENGKPNCDADATTRTPHKKSCFSENEKRFEAVAKIYNQVFEDCLGVTKVSLVNVTDPKTGKLGYTKMNKDRLKLIPYAWEIAKIRIDNWKDEDGLIDGEEPNSKHLLEWFRTYFEECKLDKWITGEERTTHKNLKLGLEYMIKPETLERRSLEK